MDFPVEVEAEEAEVEAEQGRTRSGLIIALVVGYPTCPIMTAIVM